MKRNCVISPLLISLIIGIILPSSAYAIINGGTKNINVGESLKLEVEKNTYYTVSGSWEKEGNSCYFSSQSNRSCTVTGSKAGTTTIRWVGVIGSRDAEWCWTIVVGKGGGGGEGFSGDTYFYNRTVEGISMHFGQGPINGVTAAYVTPKCITSANGRVTIPEYAGGFPVRNIYNDAFDNLSGLTELVIPNTVTWVDTYITLGCNNLKTIICEATNPPKASSSAIISDVCWSCTLYVPQGTKSKYREANGWSIFGKIKEIGVEEVEIPINATNFPDENFRKYLLDQSYGKDGVLEEEEIKNVKEISVISKDIKDLTGIEHFTALTELYCQYNSLASLDVSKNTALKVLSCFNNQLASLVVSSNTLLKNLDCSTNNLSSLDLSNNTELEILDCSLNSLTSLDVSNNSELKQISCYMNEMQVKETDDLINSLPNNRSNKSYPLYLYYNGSKITKYPSYLISSAQVAEAKKKGWTPYYYSMMDYDFYEFIGYDPKTVYDLNGDGDIDEGDIIFVVSCIMGTQGTGVDKMKADINGDKKVNATDIVELVKIIKANR